MTKRQKKLCVKLSGLGTTKKKAIEDTSVRPSKIVISEIENCTSVNTDLLLLKDINQLRDNVYRARRQILGTYIAKKY